MTQKILIVEDDVHLAAGLVRALSQEGRTVESCGNIKAAGERIKKATYHLMILDVNLPDGNGYDFLAELRKESQIPVILLTANDMETDIVTGLELGADDYITKPFSLAVLRARVNTQLRKKAQVHEVFVSGKYSFDFDNMEFITESSQVELSKTEQKLLRILTDHAGSVVRRAELVDRIWTDGSEYVDENALSVTVKRLRDKLEASEDIRTVYGIGYMWVE